MTSRVGKDVDMFDSADYGEEGRPDCPGMGSVGSLGCGSVGLDTLGLPQTVGEPPQRTPASPVDRDMHVASFKSFTRVWRLLKIKRFMDLCATFLLEVLGGAGAVWGCAEVFKVRGGPNNDDWRVVCAAVGAACLVRWSLASFFDVRYLQGDVLASFLLQVCGACGAVWGAAEMAGLRVNYPEACHAEQQGPTGPYAGPGSAWAPGYETCRSTLLPWRLVCVAVFFAFFLRWQGDLASRCTAHTRLFTMMKFLHLHVCTFVLEVLGGAGAVWGASEIVGPSGHSLRLGWGDEGFGQESSDFWRWICLVTFSACLLRWALTWRARERALEIDEEEMPMVSMLTEVQSMKPILRSASGMVLASPRLSDAPQPEMSSMMCMMSKVSTMRAGRIQASRRAAEVPSMRSTPRLASE